MRERPIFLRCPVTLRFAKTAFCNRGAEPLGRLWHKLGRCWVGDLSAAGGREVIGRFIQLGQEQTF